MEIPSSAPQINSIDQLFGQAEKLVIESGKASTSFIQRGLGIGYNKAAKLIEALEGAGVIGPANHVGKREVLKPAAPGRPIAPPITGASAKAIISFLSGEPPEHGFHSYPVDADDFGRCEMMMQSLPHVAADFARMAGANRYWAALVPEWDNIRAAKDRTAAIKAIIAPIEDGDPSVSRIQAGGPTATLRISGSAMQEAGRKRRKSPPMKETAEDKAVADNAYGVAAGELRQFVERIETLEVEKKEVADQIKDEFGEAKGRGYDTKALRAIIALRKRDKDELAEHEAIMDMYKAALGMA